MRERSQPGGLAGDAARPAVRAAAQTAGPGPAGGLTGLVGAPAAIGLSAAILGVVGASALGMLFNVNQLTLRQAITPARLLGRMNAIVRGSTVAMVPLAFSSTPRRIEALPRPAGAADA